MMKRTVVQKNQETLDKNIIPAQETVAKQQSKKAAEINSVLNKYLETDEEYDARIEEIRKKDVVSTREIKLKEVKIPKHKTIWASTDPKAKPSMAELRERGYRVVKDVEFIPTGSHSSEGAGFHILMACPEDIAKKREAALTQRAKDDYDKVFKKKIESKDGKRDFLYQENKIGEE